MNCVASSSINTLSSRKSWYFAGVFKPRCYFLWPEFDALLAGRVLLELKYDNEHFYFRYCLHAIITVIMESVQSLNEYKYTVYNSIVLFERLNSWFERHFIN